MIFLHTFLSVHAQHPCKTEEQTIAAKMLQVWQQPYNLSTPNPKATVLRAFCLEKETGGATVSLSAVEIYNDTACFDRSAVLHTGCPPKGCLGLTTYHVAPS